MCPPWHVCVRPDSSWDQLRDLWKNVIPCLHPDFMCSKKRKLQWTTDRVGAEQWKVDFLYLFSQSGSPLPPSSHLLLSKDNQLLAPADYLQLQIYGPDKRTWKRHQCLISLIKNAWWRASAKSDSSIQPSGFVAKDPTISKKNYNRAAFSLPKDEIT